MRLEDKICLITGAGSGMGRAAALVFAREGAKVAACDLKLETARETVKLIEKQGGKALAIEADVSREQSVRLAVAQSAKAFGGLDVLYNNAGIFPSDDHSVLDTEEAVWDKVFGVNVKGVYLVCKHGIPELLKRGGGSVINIASFVALVGCSVPQDAYTASKGAVIALTKSLAVQFGPQSIRSNVICPGPIETPLLTEWLLKEPKEKAKRLNRIPMGRFGKPEDIVSMALFLASDESSWTNGAVLVADGGITSNYF
ncbi:MAG: short-chain dehydrogenase [Elusimicrobia bacterium RIFCSPHIGHO2_02_FULL_57_9]|nr:MAG: short-chain dehydrogenase [Elusimicrobia bacterium RIFCSPHIGHO2_02_FULL_57_9]